MAGGDWNAGGVSRNRGMSVEFFRAEFGGPDAGGGDQYAHVVGEKTANAFGLFDMNGNVWEFCQDWYHNDYAGATTDGSAWESPMGTFRVMRGGAWYSTDAVYCRSAFRNGCDPDHISHGIGLRVVRVP